MGTTTDSTTSNNAAQVTERTDQLPRTVAGWARVEPERDETVVEYWKKGSNHVNGQYEQLRIRRLRDGEFRLVKSSFDQFQHLLSSQTINTWDDFDWLWETAQKEMDRFPANEQFDSKPELPEQVGNWELIDLSGAESLDKTRWELDWGSAELSIKETEFESHYSHTKRLEKIAYSEPAFEITVATDVPRTMAFEIAIHTLEAVQQPLSELQQEQSRLQEIKGIGPKKAQQLILLGFTTPDALETFIKHGSEINHLHGDAVDKLLTETVRDELRNL